MERWEEKSRIFVGIKVGEVSNSLLISFAR